jgi:hypothetical protein
MQTEQWAVTVATPVAPQHSTISLRHSEGGWEGEAANDTETIPLSAIVREGNHMTWTMQLARPLRLTLKFDVTITGEQMVGAVRAGLLPASNVTGKKIG